MAINLKDYNVTSYPNLYKSVTKDKLQGYKYLMFCKIENKIYKKVLGYSAICVGKYPMLDTDATAHKHMMSVKQDIEDGYISSDEIKVDKLFELYTETFDDNKRWSNDKRNIYRRYITSILGSKKISTIRPMDIQLILSHMSKNNLSPRTKKSVLEVLKPMFKFAVTNKYLKENPATDINVKIPNQKKIVTNATELFTIIFTGVTTYFKDNPFYQALFMFALTGRRKSEILNLQWKNIDFTNNYYWIEDTKNDDKQKYPLPDFIKIQLLQIKDNHTGLVFKSPITAERIVNTDRQVRGLKKHLSIDTFSLHYCRNVLVSMLAEQKTEAVILSGILGHKDVNTINKYLSINHYKSGQLGLDTIDTVIYSKQ